jgi:flagellar motor switch protein FliN/FliY
LLITPQSMEIFEELVERWIEEFGRAVEMFTGEKPDLSSLATPSETSAEDISARVWWKQTTQGDAGFALWAGATESLWTALGEGAEAQSSFFEMLSQANQGTAAVLSSGFAAPLRFEEGVREAPVLPLDVASAQIKVGFRGADAGIVVLLLDRKAFAVLSPEGAAAIGPGLEREAASASSASPAMLSRLMDLQLPVSVLLGSAHITIKEALKLMSGSVVELDRQVGDPVEIMVHGTIVAKGEIVSVKGNYGVRIKEVISRQDRIALHEAA